MISVPAIDVVEAIEMYAQGIQRLISSGAVRSHTVGSDIGEWYVEQLYQGERAANRAQAGWDIRLPTTGELLEVKTQFYTSENPWHGPIYDLSEAAAMRRLAAIRSPHPGDRARRLHSS